MTGEMIADRIMELLREKFEIINPDPDDNLREKYEFDSIDAIALLEHIENLIGFPLSHEDKKQALEIRTVRQICSYIEEILKRRNA